MKNNKFIALGLTIAVVLIITSCVFMFGKDVSAQNKAETDFTQSFNKANETCFRHPKQHHKTANQYKRSNYIFKTEG